MSVLSLYQKKIAAQTSSEDRIKEVQGLLPFWALLTGADGSIHCDSVGQNWQPVHAFKPWIARNNVPMCQCALFLPFLAHLEAPPWPTLLHVSWSSNLEVIMLANVHKSLSQCCQEALPMPVANSVCSPLRSQQSSNLTAECIQRRTPDCPWHAFWGSHSVHNTSKYRWGRGLQHQTPGSSQSSSQAMPMQIAIGRLFHKQWLLHWNLKHRHAKGFCVREGWNRKITRRRATNAKGTSENLSVIRQYLSA